jgi:prevent-host-death family protein
MKKAPLNKVKDRLSEFLHVAEKEEVVITRHGRPAGILIGFKTEDDWIDYRLQNDPRFLARIASARKSLKKGKGIRIEDLA